MNVNFYDWVEDASNRGRFEMYLDDDHVTCAYLTRFNLEIVDLVSKFGEEAIAEAIRHRYGVCGGDIWNATEPVLGKARAEFHDKREVALRRWIFAILLTLFLPSGQRPRTPAPAQRAVLHALGHGWH